jgi:GAF domain-containing protein
MDDLDRSLAELAANKTVHKEDDLPVTVLLTLRALRKHFRMDVIFLSKIKDHRRTFVAVDSAPSHDIIQPGMCDPVDQSWCYHVLQGRLPEFIQNGQAMMASGQAPQTPLPLGTHLSVPVVLPDGRVYGTLCTFACHVDEKITEKDLDMLRIAARMIGTRLAF